MGSGGGLHCAGALSRMDRAQLALSMVVREGRAGRGRSDSGSAIDWPQMQWPGWAESQKHGCKDGVGGGACTSTGHTACASCCANPSSQGLRESSPTRVGLCLTCAVRTLSAALMLRRVPLLPVPSAQASPRAHHALQEAHPYLIAAVPGSLSHSYSLTPEACRVPLSNGGPPGKG